MESSTKLHLLTITTLFVLCTLISGQTSATSSVSSTGTCIKITCASINSKKNCTLSDYPTLLTVDTSVCASDQFCYINKRLDGYCVKKTSNSDPNLLYPGDSCKSGDNSNICAFGPQTCGSNGRCVGYNVNQACARTADCNYGFYCLRGYCSPTVSIGDQCTTSDACGRTGYCYYSSLDTPAGVCVPYFSLDDSTTVGVNISGAIIVQTGAEKLCRNQMVNTTGGDCNIGLRSLRKGQNCSTALDCPTSDPLIFAPCSCGYTVGGGRYCDILGDDDEWRTAKAAFYAYFQNTQNCHPGAGLSPCGQTDLYRAMKCTNFQAKYYSLLLNNPPCVQSMFANFPDFHDYYTYCMDAGRLVASLFVVALSAVSLVLLG